MKIKITKCSDPKNCMNCIEVCPAKIFVLKPEGTKKLSDYVEVWRITTIFKDICTGCKKCVDVCPENRINVEF